MKKLYTSLQMQEILKISRQRLNQLKILRLTYQEDYIKIHSRKFLYTKSALKKITEKKSVVRQKRKNSFRRRVPVYTGTAK